VEGYPDTFPALFRQVYAAIETGRMPADPPFPTFADGHDAMLVCEAIAESARSRAWVTIKRP
jgi:predicted dehydrogenase